MYILNITSRGLLCISIDDQAWAFPSALSPRLSTSNRKHRTDAFTFPAGAGRFVQVGQMTFYQPT